MYKIRRRNFASARGHRRWRLLHNTVTTGGVRGRKKEEGGDKCYAVSDDVDAFDWLIFLGSR